MVKLFICLSICFSVRKIACSMLVLKSVKRLNAQRLALSRRAEVSGGFLFRGLRLFTVIRFRVVRIGCALPHFRVRRIFRHQGDATVHRIQMLIFSGFGESVERGGGLKFDRERQILAKRRITVLRPISMKWVCQGWLSCFLYLTACFQPCEASRMASTCRRLITSKAWPPSLSFATA